MAKRRMFSKEVLQTDWFTDMPATSQMLYVHLSLEADDDGFVTNTKIAMVNAHASKDDLAILTAKNFVIQVESGLYLIKHWKMNNILRNDRYKKSSYSDRLEAFETKEDGSYTLKKPVGYQMDTKWIPNGSTGKYRLGKESKGKASKVEVTTTDIDTNKPISQGQGRADAREEGDDDEPF